MSLRPYQKEAVGAVVDGLARGVKRQLIVLPTGAGKTRFAVELPIAARIGPQDRIMFLVHRDELAQQAASAFSQRWPQVKIGIEKADQYSNGAQIVIGSVQTLQNNRLKSLNADHFKLIIQDEAHHAVARTFRSVLSHLRCAKGDPMVDRLMCGLTATPNRSDSVGLEGIFDEIVYEKTIRSCIEEGWLVHPAGVTVETETDLRSVDRRYGEYVIKQLEKQINTPFRNKLVVDTYLRISNGGNAQAIAFTANVQHSEDLAAAMREAHVSAFALHGKTPLELRRRVVQSYRKGELKVLVSAEVLTEGADFPMASIALMASAIGSGLKYRQCCGRVMRPFPSPEEVAAKKAAGIPIGPIKDKCYIVDFVDLSKHSLHTASSLIGLRSGLNTRGRSILEVAEEIEAAQKEYDVDLIDLADIAQINTYIQQVDLMTPPTTPSEVAGMSKYPWLHDAGGYRLSLFDNTVMLLAEDSLGQWAVHQVERNARHLVSREKNLKDAVRTAEKFIPASERKAISLAAKWRGKRPTEPQLELIWKLEQKFHTVYTDYRYFRKDAMDKLNRGGASTIITRAIERRKAEQYDKK